MAELQDNINSLFGTRVADTPQEQALGTATVGTRVADTPQEQALGTATVGTRVADTPQEQALETATVGARVADTPQEQALEAPELPNTAEQELVDRARTQTKKRPRNRLPTLQNFLSGQTGQATEQLNSLEPLTSRAQEALDPAKIFSRKFKDLDKVSPGDAAHKGAMLGGLIGLDQGGPSQALIGTAIGSLMARGIADAESGRAEKQQKRNKVVDVLNKMGVVGKDGTISFNDKTSFTLSPNEALRIKNQGTLGNLAKDRATFELDKSNPFSNRATKMTRGVAHLINSGIMNFSDLNNASNLAVLDNVTGYLVNAATKDADSINTVKTRLKEVMDKLNVDEKKLRGFLESTKGQIPPDEAVQIKEGLELLFGD